LIKITPTDTPKKAFTFSSTSKIVQKTISNRQSHKILCLERQINTPFTPSQIPPLMPKFVSLQAEIFG